MKKAEKYGIEEQYVSSAVLMENAALNVVEYIKEKFSEKTRIVIFCGKGNNGGDGYAIARGLFARGFKVCAVPCGDAMKGSPDCMTNYKSALACGVTFSEDYIDAAENADVIVDAIIGTGLSGELSESAAEWCRAINSSDAHILAVDCPTGINSDTAEVYENAVKADVTYTFHCPKPGLLFFPAREYVGRLMVGSIGIPQREAGEPYLHMLTKSEARAMLPKRIPSSHKGTYGKVFSFSGSDEMTGAALLGLKAAYLCGAGLAIGVCLEKTADVIHLNLPEAVTKIVTGKDGCLTEDAYLGLENIADVKTVLTGSGLGVTEGTKALVEALVKNIKGTLVIDADGLNCLMDSLDILKDSPADIVITPHMGEMSRLTGLNIGYIKAEPIKTALAFAKEYGVVVVLKDASTVIASPTGKAYINTTGCSVMSKGGSGDVLAGLIAGFAAQNTDSFTAAVLGTFINGLSGEQAAELSGSRGALASDTAGCIPFIIDEVNGFAPI